jgi:hypothetical protein
MNNARRDAIYLWALGSSILIILGTVLANTSSAALVDFRVLYYPARCLLNHGDPYNESEVLHLARAEGGERAADVTRANHFARYIYPPSTFSFTIPFALLPWRLAHIVWMALIGGGLVFAGWLILDLGADYSPLITGALIGFLLANCELLIVVGNSAGLAIALCVVAVWCFLREQLVEAGVLCFAISLAFKPHDTGLVWLYFLLAGGCYRKCALQSLLAATVMSLPGMIWVWSTVPNWIQEMHSNMLAFSEHGGLTDPAFASAGGIGLGLMVNLQTVFSSFWSDPQIYNEATYIVCGFLILTWIIAVLRSRPSVTSAWIALAAIAPLTMLPVYHRQNDTKLLLLTVPGCAALWAKRGVIGWLAVVLNCAGFLITGDLSWTAILAVLSHILPAESGLVGSCLRYAQIYSAPIALLILSSFYLWVHLRRPDITPAPQETTGIDDLTLGEIENRRLNC